ncbi:MAG: MBL fold metallo-hydrolase [Candidatus Aureabacteria bacterium]|nr:MBL fold metallo-hydrolase [Candidatus Auribacterota bacterium]
MKLTVLADNNTITDRYYFAEPAVSYWIEADNKNILFDVGYSDLFIKNAELLHIDLKKADHLVLSHGHMDHTGGLQSYIDLAGKRTKSTTLIAHPLVFNKKIYPGFGSIGIRKSKKEIQGRFNLHLSKTPLWLTENLCFLGEIPRKNNFEARKPLGFVMKNGKKFPDYSADDSALAYRSSKGIIVITGCSHSGIVNITEYAKKICGNEKILDIIGGLHLLNASKSLLQKTIRYFKSNKITAFHPCHCTDLKAKIELGKHFPIQETGSGSILTYRS